MRPQPTKSRSLRWSAEHLTCLKRIISTTLNLIVIEDNEGRYQYDKSVPLRTHLVIPPLPPEGLQPIRAVYTQLNYCVGPQHTKFPSTRGKDILDKIAPTCMSNVLLVNLLSSQFAADRDVLVIPTTATSAIVHDCGRLAPTVITPLLEFIRQSLLRCKWHF